MKFSDFMILPLIALLLSAISYYHYVLRPTPLPPIVLEPEIVLLPKPDFLSYHNVKQKKRDYFAYMLPMVKRANRAYLDLRNQIQSHIDGKPISAKQTQRLTQLWHQYRVKGDLDLSANGLKKLLVKIDIVPASLILAQSANESAWGTSRFAIQANNFFGIWCFSKGCGLKPLQREDGLQHEVAKYASVQAGVYRYIRTINSHPAYKKLRDIRRDFRQQNKTLTGVPLAGGLELYSERGEAYVEEIRAMIQFNNLQRFDLEEEKEVEEGAKTQKP